MRFAVAGSCPIFLGTESGGGSSTICPSQIIDFDIYYTEGLVVGFQVIDSDEDDCIGNFFAELVLDNC